MDLSFPPSSWSLWSNITARTQGLQLLEDKALCPPWPQRLSLCIPRAPASPPRGSGMIPKSCLPQTHSPELPKGSPCLLKPSRGFSHRCSGTAPGASGGGAQTSGLACRVSPLWAATQSSGKHQVWLCRRWFLEWDGHEGEGEMLALAGSFFPPHMFPFQTKNCWDSPKHSSLRVNNIPACPCIMPMMKNMLWSWGKSLDWLFFSTVLAPDPRSSAVLAIRGFALRAVFISGHTWNPSWRADRETKTPSPTSIKTNPSTFSPRMFNIPRESWFCLEWLLNPSV